MVRLPAMTDPPPAGGSKTTAPASAGAAVVEVAGKVLHLLPERAILWPAEGMLLVADLHWGKGAVFRNAGVPVPPDAEADDLARLERVLRAGGARRLAVLGDLLHDRGWGDRATLAAVAAWRERLADVEILLVRGNHDRRAGDPPAGWRMTIVDEAAPGPFLLRHHPDPDPTGPRGGGRYVLAGHLHPAVSLRGAGRARVRLPCFHFGAGVGVLPAFGGFTGTADIKARRGDRVFAIAEGEVLAVPMG